MMRRLVFSVLLSASLVQAEEQTAACKAARAPVDYDVLVIPQDFKDLVEGYRADWRSFCSKSKVRPTMAMLYEKGQKILKEFIPVEQANTDHNVAIDDLISNKYLLFIPAFTGYGGDQSYFGPSPSEYRRNVSFGTKEDRVFFESSIPRGASMFYPWDDFFCTKYGDFDWVAAVKELVQVKKDVKSTAYLLELSAYEASLLSRFGVGDLKNLGTIRTCGILDATGKFRSPCIESEGIIDVLKDLRTMRPIFEKEPTLKVHLPALDKFTGWIESGQVAVTQDCGS